jgi:cysteine desulfurase
MAGARLYFDNAASTPPTPEVLAAHARAAAEHFANPSSAHTLGAAATRALEAARAEVATLVGAEPGEIVFTSGGTEADALGLLGALPAARGAHVVISAIEHSAVLRTAESLAQRGHTVSKVAPGPDGVVRPADVVAAVGPDTAVVAVMLVNNELGTVQPIAEIAAALRQAGCGAHLHVDAVQAAGLCPVDVRTLGAGSLALSGHKFHGMKGTGALWVAKDARLEPLWGGGRQERGLRSGTENVPGCVALGAAAAAFRADREAYARVRGLRDRLEEMVLAALPAAQPTIPREIPRAPHIASFLLPDLPAEPVLHALEAAGVFVSAGSACASRSQGQSHVLEAIGIAEGAAVLRFSLSRLTTEAELEPAAAALAAAVRDVTEVAAFMGPGKRGRRPG